MVVGISLLLICVFFAFQYESVEVNGRWTRGKVLSHHSGRTGIRAANPYFMVELESGETVKVRDLGLISPYYKGVVCLKEVTGDFTGSMSYRIDRVARGRPCGR